MESEIEKLLRNNSPADALSLSDLALLLESIEKRKEIARLKAAPPVRAAAAAPPISSPAVSGGSGIFTIGYAVLHSLTK